MRAETAVKVAVAGVVLFLFGAFILRAALKLASTAMNSLFGIAIVLAIAVWLLVKARRRS